MPTRDRRPRRRQKPRERDIDQSLEAFHVEARVATPADWDGGLRRRFIRYLIEKGKTPEIAAGIVRAYEKRPALIPAPPPRN